MIPDLLAYKAGVLPLNEQPINQAKGPSGNRTRSSSLPRTRAATTPTDPETFHRDGAMFNGHSAPRIGHTNACTTMEVTRVGIEPTKSQRLELLALPVCVPGHTITTLLGSHYFVRCCAIAKLQVTESNRETGLMRAGWDPAHLHCYTK